MSRRSKLRHSEGAELAWLSGPIAGTSGRAFPAESRWDSQRGALAICIFLALAIWAVFGQTLHYGFVNYDDGVCVYDNPAITRRLTWSGVVWAFTHFNNYEWYPLTSISHMLDCQIFGLNAGGHHLTNVLLHTATAISLFLVLRTLTGAFWRSAFVAAVFALHPLRVESVAWVTERKDVLSGLFFVLTIGAYIRYARQPFRTGRYLLVLGLFTLGLLSKAMVATLPFVLLLLDYWPLERWCAGSHAAPGPKRLLNRAAQSSPPLRRLIIEKIPLLLLAGASCLTTFLAAKNVESVEAAQSLTFAHRISNALVAYVDYLGHLFYPVGLAVGYSDTGNDLAVLRVAWSVMVLLIISAVVVVWRRRSPWMVVGWLWFLGMLVPVIDIMQSGHEARADRYTYLPQIGLAVLIAWSAVELGRPWRYRGAVLGSAAVAILAGLMAAAHLQTAYWKDSVSLWTHCLACAPGDYVAHNDLGIALVLQGRREEAIHHFERALEIKPDDSEAHNNLGLALAAQGSLTEAIRHCTRALELKPDFAKAHLNLGIALDAEGRSEEAIYHFKQALRLKPDYSDAQFNLGRALAAQGKSAQAIEHFNRALQLKPNYSEAEGSLGLALARQGNLPQAIDHLRRALELKPDYSEGHNNLGVALASQGKMEEAIHQFERALELKADNSEARTNLGRALAARGASDKPSPSSQEP